MLDIVLPQRDESQLKEILGQACNSAILARIGFVEAQEG